MNKARIEKMVHAIAGDMIRDGYDCDEIVRKAKDLVMEIDEVPVD